MRANHYSCGEVILIKARVIRDCRKYGYRPLAMVEDDGSLTRIVPPNEHLDKYDLIVQTINEHELPDGDSIILHIPSTHTAAR